MFFKLIFVSILVVHNVLAVKDHQIVKRHTFVTGGLIEATNHWTQFLSNSWNQLRDGLKTNGSDPLLEISEFQKNLTNLRTTVTNSTTNAAKRLLSRLKNVTQHLNSVLRDRADTEHNLVTNLYDMIINTTINGTNHSINTLRNAFTTATQTMAESYSGLANSSLVVALDLKDKSYQLFNNALIRAGNDTNRAVIAATTAINSIRNSSQQFNETVGQIVANLAENVQKLSERLRNLLKETNDTGVHISIVNEFRQKAEQSFQSLVSNMNQLRNSLGLFSSNDDIDATDDNIDGQNEVNVVKTATKSLSDEMEALRKKIESLKTEENLIFN